MSIGVTDFKARLPEYIAQPDSRVQVFIDDAVVVLNETYWGLKYNMGLCYLSAHYLSLALKSGASPGNVSPVSSKSVDGVAVAFAVAAPAVGTDEFYQSTVYGQRYLALRASLGVAACSI